MMSKKDMVEFYKIHRIGESETEAMLSMVEFVTQGLISRDEAIPIPAALSDTESFYYKNPFVHGGDTFVITKYKPEWKPKDGEAVLIPTCGLASCGIYHDGGVYSGINHKYPMMAMKPFDPSKLGMNWEEI